MDAKSSCSGHLMLITPERVFYAGLLGAPSVRTMGSVIAYVAVEGAIRHLGLEDARGVERQHRERGIGEDGMGEGGGIADGRGQAVDGLVRTRRGRGEERRHVGMAVGGQADPQVEA